MTLIEIRPHRWGWKVFESPGIEPVFPEKVIGGLQSFTASQCDREPRTLWKFL
jgi:hypothetical protein